MAQSRIGSLIESLANVAVGYGIAVATQLIVFPLFGLHVSVGENMQIAGVFTAISIARSFLLRRFFNRIHS